ncbi:MAG: type I-B CRISPR-associated protein Cas5b [Nitrososphaeria archaeon]
MNSEVLYIELFQPYAQYRNPFTFYYAQTFPLPPKSTIIGMLQNACDDWYGNKLGIENWWNLKVSVHGGFESVFWNYQSLIKGSTYFVKSKDGKILGLENQEMPLYGKGKTSQRSPVYQQELFNGHLHIFLKGELIDEIKRALEKSAKVLSLGRSEDIVFIRNIAITSGDEIDEDIFDLTLTYPTYIKNNIYLKMKKYPVYSIPTKVIFKNNDKAIKNKSELNTSTFRDVDFQTVVYTGYDYTVEFVEPVRFTLYKEGTKEFYIINEYGWL